MVMHQLVPDSFDDMESMGNEDIGFNNYMREANTPKTPNKEEDLVDKV